METMAFMAHDVHQRTGSYAPEQQQPLSSVDTSRSFAMLVTAEQIVLQEAKTDLEAALDRLLMQHEAVLDEHATRGCALQLSDRCLLMDRIRDIKMTPLEHMHKRVAAFYTELCTGDPTVFELCDQQSKGDAGFGQKKQNTKNQQAQGRAHGSNDRMDDDESDRDALSLRFSHGARIMLLDVVTRHFGKWLP
jgi:hypothetical protein